jgi:hypothetical protein
VTNAKLKVKLSQKILPGEYNVRELIVPRQVSFVQPVVCKSYREIVDILIVINFVCILIGNHAGHAQRKTKLKMHFCLAAPQESIKIILAMF